MNQEAILCIPGPWASRSDFVRTIIQQEPAGEFMFAGDILAHPKGKDHVPLTFCEPDPHLVKAFQIAGQGQLTPSTLASIASHSGVAYLHFPIAALDQRLRMAKFSNVLRRAGGYAIKVESSGVAHEWDRWSSLISGSTFDLYCSLVTLVGDAESCYSCGMHHFELPETSVPRSLDLEEAADLINRFSFWQIDERPVLQTGQTFSLSPHSPHFRLALEEDREHTEDDLFHNPHGIWHLSPES